MNRYEERQEERRERLQARAEKARSGAQAAYQHSNELLDPIPMGQPILVGHHSEKGHRKTLERSNNAMGKSVALTKKAEELERRADSVGKGGVSSDDPDAITKLQEKLAHKEGLQDLMKRVNKAYRAGGWDKVAQDVPDCSEGVRKAAEQGMAHDWQEESKRRPFPQWQLSNNNAEINRLKKRIKTLQAQEDMEEIEEQYEGFKLAIEENRVRFFFDGKPEEEIRTLLKRAGFKWAPSVQAWQRQATSNGVASARYMVEQLRAKMTAAA